MEIKDCRALKLVALELTEKIDPIQRLSYGVRIMDNRYGGDMTDRAEHFEEEAKELKEALIALDNYVGDNAECADHEAYVMAFDVLWELSDVTMNYFQLFSQVLRAIGWEDSNDLKELLTGMGVLKQKMRETDKGWDPLYDL